MKLRDVIKEFISGDWGQETISEETQNAVFCIRGADIIPITNNNLDYIPKRYISYKSKQSRLLQKGDIIIEKSGGSPVQSTGRVVYISEKLIHNKGDIVCSNFCCAIRIKESWNPKFVYYYWWYMYNTGIFFNYEGKTSGIKNLMLNAAISSIEIPSFSLKVQDKIVEILDRFENKIAINREINRNLEALTRLLYNYWFVQFDFPDENGRPYKSSGGRMVWNEKLKREIPEGWFVEKLIDIANITMGQSPEGASYNTEGLGDIFYQGSTDFGIRFPTIRQFTTKPTRFAKRGDILMSVRAPVGVTNIANTNCCIGRGLAAINSKLGSISHLYFVIQDLKTTFESRNEAGTTFGSITKGDLHNLLVIKPTKKILQDFEELCKLSFEEQIKIEESINILVRQRDELLPLLMNGQVSVNTPGLNCDLSPD